MEEAQLKNIIEDFELRIKSLRNEITDLKAVDDRHSGVLTLTERNIKIIIKALNQHQNNVSTAHKEGKPNELLQM